MQHLSETLEFASEFRTLWLGHEELRQKMIGYIHSRVLSGYPEYVEQLVSRLDHLTMYTDLNDKQIFTDLGGHLYNEISDREEMHDILQEDNNKRANNRSQAILDLLTDDFLPGSVLDYGCHSGKILVELAETLNIPSAQRFGMDVAMPADCREFQFLLSDDTCSQFESDSLELIIALVVLHHLPRPREIIAEFYRILRPGGQACRYLVIDFGTSKSPKSTRQPDSHYCPGRPASVPLRHTFVNSALATQHSLK
ncbi:class I SAM-dependent methyltransferase [Thiolapillus sp.]|uniref:class I SAM-dependent methyltransferase n=1 Tax=Thiolapillus sp. TaxID=2017437 RepID=UPI0025F65278|nr:class I SAM-dependent methyltransferase [Thiolapillus sp.]